MSKRSPHQPRIPKQFLSNPLGPGLEALTAYLVERGYTPHTIRLYVRTAAHFGQWLAQAQIEPAAITEGSVATFLHDHLPQCRCTSAIRSLKVARAVLRHLLTALRQTGQIPSPPVPRLTPIEQEVERFAEHLRTVCGHAEATVLYRTRYVREFLTATYHHRSVRLAALTPQDILAFVRQRAPAYQPQSVRVLTSSLRSYLRFLCLRGEVTQDLVRAVPAVAGWRQAHLPSTLSDEQIEKLLAAFDRSTPTGRRDYAICLGLAELGLRTSEVAGLCLDAIDWRAGTLRVASTKTRRARLLPLPARLGQALVEYLQDGRPASTDRHVFLRHVAPRGLGIGPRIVQNAVDRACAKAGERRCGPHRFRHAFASRLYAHGATFKGVADLLGHQDLNTVAIYAKVDLTGLAQAALPWPEVHP